METLPTATAAQRLADALGVPVNAQKFFRLAAKHKVAPAMEAPGKRGAKFWDAKDVEWIGRLERDRENAA